MDGHEGNKRLRYLVVLLGVLACLAVLISCPSPVEGGDSDDMDAKSILRALGVDAVDAPPDLTTTNTQGDEVTIDDPDAWHPLRKTYAIFNPKSEVTFFGIASAYHPTYYNSVFGLTADYSENNFITDDQSWEKWANKVACAADLDGDGLDEFVIFYVVSGSFYLRVYDYGTGSYSSALNVTDIAPSDEIADEGSYNFNMDNLCRYLHLCPADVDGDGTDELLLADYDTVYVVETDNGAGDLTVQERNTYSAYVSSLAAGDTDGDGEDEFVVCVQGKGFGYYDSDLDKPLSNPEMVTYASMGLLEACIGDFDGDSVDELAVTNGASSSTTIYAYETTVNTGNLSLESTITGVTRLSFTGYRSDPCAVDLDGDGNMDLYAAGSVIMDPLGGGATTYSVSPFFTGGTVGSLDQVGVGDMDGDGKQDLVLLYNYSVSSVAYAKTVTVGLNTTGSLVAKAYPYDYVTSCAVYTDTTIIENIVFNSFNALFGSKRTLAIGNVDKDSARVKYTGHELKFTDPAVVAVLASPPYWSAVADADAAYAGSYTNWETSYGTVTSSSTSNGLTLGASVGATVKFEQEGGVFGIKLAQFESELTTKAYLNQEISWSSTISKSVSYTAVGGEDKVIFTCIPIDVYSYEVLESPDSVDVGSTLTLEIPRDYKMYSVTRSFFNENNGKVNDIDSTVLAHTYGNPASYPSKSDMQTLRGEYGGYKSTSALPVVQGNDNQASGVQNLEIAVESGFEVTTAVGVEVEASVGGGAGGASVLANLGFSVGYTGTISTSTGTTFGGTVGYLPTTYYSNAAYNYSSGLFVYPFSDERDGRQYWIVDYWVE